MNINLSSCKAVALGIALVFSVPVMYAMNPSAPKASSAASSSSSAMPQQMPSEAELQQFEAQLKKEIDDAVNQMSPDQQKVFFDTMEKLDKMSQTDEGRQKLEKLVTGEMSEDELNSFLEAIMPEEAKETPAPSSSAVETKPAPKPAPAPAPKPTGKQEQLRIMIQNIIEKTNSFLLKTGTYAKLAAKVGQWQTKGLVRLPAKATWNSFRASLYEFVQKLHKAIELDKKSGAYKHLEELAKQEPLVQQLTKIEKILVQHEPQIEESGTIEAELNNKSQKAIQAIINGLNASVHEARVNEELELIFTKFEPAAKKSQEEEKALREKAVQEQKKGRQPGVTTTAGSRSAEAQGGAFAPTYPASLNRPSSGSFPSGAGEAAAKPEAATEAGKKEAGKGGAAADKGKKGEEGKDKDKKGKDEDKEGKEKGKKEAEKKKEAPLTKEQKEIQDLMAKDPMIPFYSEQVTEKMGDLDKMLKNPLLADIKNHLTDPTKPVDVKVANSVIPGAIRLINDETTGLIHDIDRVKKRLQNKKISGQAIQGMQRELKKAYDGLMKTAQPFMQQVEDIKQNWDGIKDSVSKEKQYAYLRIDTAAAAPDMGDLSAKMEELEARMKRREITEAEAKKLAAEMLGKMSAPDPLAAIKAKVVPQPFPASIIDLQAALLELGKTISNLGK